MAFKFTSEPQEFMTQWRNGNDFSTDTSNISYRLRGNVGDLVQMTEQITVECSVNESLSIPLSFDSTAGTLSSRGGLNFRAEGLFVGATVQVIQGVNEGEAEVLNITARGFTALYLDSTNLGFLTDGTHTDIWIRVKDAPTYMRYQYGVIASGIQTESEQIWNSPIDGNAQAYYKYDIVQPSYELFDMIRFGIFKSWDLTESIKVAYAGNPAQYFHTFDIIHQFRINPYVESETENMLKVVPPTGLSRTSTFKYANKYFVGYDSEVVGSVTNLGVTGDVGYYEQNYNGKENVYAIESVSVTNPSGLNVLSVTEVNDIAITVTNSDNRFVTAQKFIVSLIRLAPSGDYTNKRTKTWGEVFGFDSVRKTISAMDPPTDSSQLQNVDAVFVNDSEFTVSLQIEFTDDQQAEIRNGDKYAILLSTGENGRPPDLEDNATLIVQLQEFEKDPSITDLIYDVTFAYYDSFGANDGDRVYTNRAEWNGNFVGFNLLFKLRQYDNGTYNRITSVVSRLVLVNDTDSNDIRKLWVKEMPLSPNPTSGASSFVDNDFNYQIANGTSNDTAKLPSGEPLNFNMVRSVPPYPANYQTFEISGSIPRIPWRDWIANLDIPLVNFDPAEPNNNLNQKTSNYSGVNGYSIFHEIYLMVDYTEIVQVSTTGGVVKPQEQTTTTPYHLRSDEFEIVDFDLDGNPSVEIEGEIIIYNIGGGVVNDLSSTQPRLIEGVVTHDLGTLDINDIWAEIWIEKENATSEVMGQLHSAKDWSSTNNPLTGSQEVSPTNFNYVELVSQAGVVYLYCQTNPNNFESGVSYNIYCKLGKKTV